MALFASDPTDPRNAAKVASRGQLVEAFLDVVERNGLTVFESLELLHDLMEIPLRELRKEDRDAHS